MSYVIFIEIASLSHGLVPCRETHFGCCPDGETSAHGMGGVGCPGKLNLLDFNTFMNTLWLKLETHSLGYITLNSLYA